MADTIKWLFEMIDKVSGPSKTASSSLSTFIQTTHSALAATQLLGQAAMGAGRLIAAGLQPAISKEKSLGAFETLLGTAEKARDMYGQAVRFAAETPFETADVVDSFQRLLTARFAQEEVPIAMRIIGDAASMQEDSKQAVASVTRALSQIRSKGRLQGEELMQIQEAVPLNTAQLYERLGVIYGTNADAARKMQEAGQIDSQVASFAILAQLQEQFGGNMEKSSKQIGGLLSTLQSRPSELLSQLQDTSGYKRLSESLTGVVDKFSESSVAGQKLQDMVKGIGDSILNDVAIGIEYAASGFEAFVDGLSAGLGPMNEAFGPTNQSNLENFKVIMERVGAATAGLVNGVNMLGNSLKVAWDYFYKIGEWMTANESITSFLDKYIAPIMLEQPTQGSSSGTTQDVLIGAKRLRENDALRAQLNGSVNPLDIPEFAEGAIVNGRTLAYVGEKGPEVIAPIERGSISPLPGAMGGVNLSVSVMVNGGGSAAESLGQDIGYRVRVEMMSLLEQAGLQSGRLRTS